MKANEKLICIVKLARYPRINNSHNSQSKEIGHWTANYEISFESEPSNQVIEFY